MIAWFPGDGNANDLTVDMWVQPASAAQALYDGSGNLRVQAGNDAVHVLFGPADATKLHHIAMTSQGTTITTYLDGDVCDVPTA